MHKITNVRLAEIASEQAARIASLEAYIASLEARIANIEAPRTPVQAQRTSTRSISMFDTPGFEPKTEWQRNAMAARRAAMLNASDIRRHSR